MPRTTPDIDFSLLADRVEAIPLVAEWYFNDHGHKIADNSFEKTCERIRGKLNRETPPLHVLAIDGDRVVGVAQWKPYEMPEFPEKKHWLGSVFVPPQERGRGIGSALAQRVAEVAKSHGADEIYLSTEKLDGGLYARVGWRPFQRAVSRGDQVLVMVKRLDV